MKRLLCLLSSMLAAGCLLLIIVRGDQADTFLAYIAFIGWAAASMLQDVIRN
jgi:hypothetical protein